MTKTIDTDAFSATLRERGIDAEGRRLAITRFDGSEQAKDLTEPANCNGFGRIRHFKRATAAGWPENPLPIDPAARALGLPTGLPELRAQVFQNAVCNWRCWYCFVDFPLLSGNPRHSAMLSPAELFDLYLAEADRPAMIDLTGGQPDLVPEWTTWMLEERQRRGLDDVVYLWSDDNLSNAYFWEKLTPQQRSTVFAAPAYGKVCCFKGFDAASFAFNTGAAPELFGRQFELMRRLVRDTPIDLYAYTTFTAPAANGLEAAMRVFVDRLQDIDASLPLRTVPLQVLTFAPTRGRMGREHERALAVQEDAIAAWRRELGSRFDDDVCRLPIWDVNLRHH